MALGEEVDTTQGKKAKRGDMPNQELELGRKSSGQGDTGGSIAVDENGVTVCKKKIATETGKRHPWRFTPSDVS